MIVKCQICKKIEYNKLLVINNGKNIVCTICHNKHRNISTVSRYADWLPLFCNLIKRCAENDS